MLKESELCCLWRGAASEPAEMQWLQPAQAPAAPSSLGSQSKRYPLRQSPGHQAGQEGSLRSQGPGEWILDLVTVTGCSEQEEGGVECLFPAWGCGSPESSTNRIRVSEVFTPSWGGDPVVETAGNRGSLKANPCLRPPPRALSPHAAPHAVLSLHAAPS